VVCGAAAWRPSGWPRWSLEGGGDAVPQINALVAASPVWRRLGPLRGGQPWGAQPISPADAG